MLVPADNRFGESQSPHSLANRLAMTIPSPGWDTNPLMITQKEFWGGGMQGVGCSNCGMGGLTFDGSGFLGTGLFSGDVTTWGFSELIAGVIGLYAVYSMIFQTKQTKYRLEQSAHKRRKSRAARLREKAKKLEEREVGGIF